MTTLPMDRDNNPIPALALNPNGAHIINVTNTATRNTTAFETDTRVISIYATDDIFVQFGDSNVTTTTSDHFLPKGLYYDFAIGGDKVMHMSHVATIASSADCTVYISEKQ